MIIRSDLLSLPTKEKTKGNKQSENSQGFASVESSASETHTGNAGEPKGDLQAVDYVGRWDKEGHPTPHPNPNPKHTSSWNKPFTLAQRSSNEKAVVQDDEDLQGSMKLHCRHTITTLFNLWPANTEEGKAFRNMTHEEQLVLSTPTLVNKLALECW